MCKSAVPDIMPSSSAETSLAQIVMSLLLTNFQEYPRLVIYGLRDCTWSPLVPYSPLIPLLGKACFPLPSAVAFSAVMHCNGFICYDMRSCTWIKDVLFIE